MAQSAHSRVVSRQPLGRGLGDGPLHSDRDRGGPSVTAPNIPQTHRKKGGNHNLPVPTQRSAVRIGHSYHRWAPVI